MCKTKQGSKLVDMREEFMIFRDVNDRPFHISKRSMLAVLADYVFEIDTIEGMSVLHSPEYWLPKGEDIV